MSESAKHELKKLLQPKNYASYWVLIHKKAFKAVTMERKIKYEQFVHELVEELECNHCREDAMKYLRDHPIRSFFGIKDEKSGADIGCFKHSWLFHNHVNKKTGKKEIDWITTLGMYADVQGCDECGTGSSKEEGKKEGNNRKVEDKRKAGKYSNERGTQIKIVDRYRR